MHRGQLIIASVCKFRVLLVIKPLNLLEDCSDNLDVLHATLARIISNGKNRWRLQREVTSLICNFFRNIWTYLSILFHNIMIHRLQVFLFLLMQSANFWAITPMTIQLHLPFWFVKHPITLYHLQLFNWEFFYLSSWIPFTMCQTLP